MKFFCMSIIHLKIKYVKKIILKRKETLLRMPITKKEVYNLPLFENDQSAIEYFENRSGNNFIIHHVREVLGGQKIYLCYLLLKNEEKQFVNIFEDGLVKVEF